MSSYYKNQLNQLTAERNYKKNQYNQEENNFKNQIERENMLYSQENEKLKNEQRNFEYFFFLFHDQNQINKYNILN